MAKKILSKDGVTPLQTDAAKKSALEKDKKHLPMENRLLTVYYEGTGKKSTKGEDIWNIRWRINKNMVTPLKLYEILMKILKSIEVQAVAEAKALESAIQVVPANTFGDLKGDA